MLFESQVTFLIYNEDTSGMWPFVLSHFGGKSGWERKKLSGKSRIVIKTIIIDLSFDLGSTYATVRRRVGEVMDSGKSEPQKAASCKRNRRECIGVSMK